MVITNFGGATQSDFEVTFVLNDGESVTEVVAGPLEGNSTMEYTFTQTVDLSIPGTYTLTVTLLYLETMYLLTIHHQQKLLIQTVHRLWIVQLEMDYNYSSY